MDCGTWCKKARTQGKFIYSTAPKAHSLSRSIISSFHFARNFSRCPQRRVNSEWQPSFLPSLLLSQGVCATSRGAKTHACIFLYSLSMDTDSAGQRYGRNDWNFIIRESAASLFFFFLRPSLKGFPRGFPVSMGWGRDARRGGQRVLLGSLCSFKACHPSLGREIVFPGSWSRGAVTLKPSF